MTCIILANRYKAVVAFELIDQWLAKSYSLESVQVIQPVVAFKFLDHWLADSYSLKRFQLMRFAFANKIEGVVASSYSNILLQTLIHSQNFK